MIVGLDSAFAPTSAQAALARAAGIGSWNGYLSEIPQRDGLYHPWTLADFEIVKTINPRPIAFTSGWDDPVGAKAMAAQYGVLLCLDVERLIRPDGAWVQAWLDASSAGLYGVQSVHVGRHAAFHIAAWYPGYDPKSTYPAGWPGSQPCAWQWQNTHTEFGVGVDRGYYDDWFKGEDMGVGFKDEAEHEWVILTLQQLAGELLDAAAGDGVRKKFSTLGAAVLDIQKTVNAIKAAGTSDPAVAGKVDSVITKLDQIRTALHSA